MRRPSANLGEGIGKGVKKKKKKKKEKYNTDIKEFINFCCYYYCRVHNGCPSFFRVHLNDFLIVKLLLST